MARAYRCLGHHLREQLVGLQEGPAQLVANQVLQLSHLWRRRLRRLRAVSCLHQVRLSSGNCDCGLARRRSLIKHFGIKLCGYKRFDIK